MNATLLLIPGLLNTPRVFDRFLAEWRGPAEVRVADIRGGKDIPAMAEAAWARVADVPAAQPLVVAGFSLGGYVAQHMMATPQRTVQGLGLICTSARADTPEGAQVRVRTIAALDRDFERCVNSLIGFMVSPARADDTALKDEMRRDMLEVGAATAIGQHRAAATRLDQRALLPTWRQPCCVVGARADKVTPPELSEELARLLPAAELTLIDDAGHMVPMEHPDALAQALHSLVERALKAPTKH